MQQLLVAGGGIGGIATALAASRAGWHARVFEQALAFSEVGAGVQLGPNATRVLRALDRLQAVQAHACAPVRLVARDALRARALASLSLGPEFEARYGAPYLTVHRADLHAALLEGVQGQEVSLHAGTRIVAFEETPLGVHAVTADGSQPEGDALAGADGLWSVVRPALLDDGLPRPSDHVAYRALIPMDRLSATWQAPEVTAWLGPHLHAVTYPVRGGAMLNVVCVVHQQVEGPRNVWDLPGAAERLRASLGAVCDPLQAVVEAAPSWGLWVLHDRDPVAGPRQLAQGRIALLGDAAHPMRPYLAQGASMALEDALEMGRCLGAVRDRAMDLQTALRRYALNRWQRVAQVQRRSLRNGSIFHAAGPLRLARDLALQGAGARLMDMPWLYGH